MELPIIHQDPSIIVVDKPAGISVHPSDSDKGEDTVMDLLSSRIDDPESDRPGIVHRLDKDTSGLLLVARTKTVREYLQKQFKQRKVEKTYLTAVNGKPKLDQARLEWPLSRSPKNPLKRAIRPGGKMAITEYRLLESRGGYSLLEIKLHTGRTHQIRAHMQYLGHPVLGDTLYGRPVKGLDRQFLHAHVLKFNHPEGSRVEFRSELHNDLRKFWDGLL